MTHPTTQIQKHSVDSATPQPNPPLLRLAQAAANRRERAESLASQLTPEQYRQVIEWVLSMPIHKAVQRIAAPSPEGFGIKTHPTTLSRLRSRLNADLIIKDAEEMLDTIDDVEQHTDLSQLDRVQKTISQILHRKAFELAQTAPDSEALPKLLDSMNKLSALDHKRQKLLIEREKLQILASRGAARHHRVDLNILRPEPSFVGCTANAENPALAKNFSRPSTPSLLESVKPGEVGQ